MEPAGVGGYTGAALDPGSSSWSFWAGYFSASWANVRSTCIPCLVLFLIPSAVGRKRSTEIAAFSLCLA